MSPEVTFVLGALLTLTLVIFMSACLTEHLFAVYPMRYTVAAIFATLITVLVIGGLIWTMV